MKENQKLAALAAIYQAAKLTQPVTEEIAINFLTEKGKDVGLAIGHALHVVYGKETPYHDEILMKALGLIFPEREVLVLMRHNFYPIVEDEKGHSRLLILFKESDEAIVVSPQEVYALADAAEAAEVA